MIPVEEEEVVSVKNQVLPINSLRVVATVGAA